MAILLLLSLKADTCFIVPQRVEGRVDLCTAVKVCSPCPRLYRSCHYDKHNRLWWDSNLGPVTPRSDVLTTRPLISLIVLLVVCDKVLVLVGRAANIYPLSYLANHFREHKITPKMQFCMWFSGKTAAAVCVVPLHIFGLFSVCVFMAPG